MKLKYVRWRNRALKYLKEADRPMTTSALLDATKDKRSPRDAKHASQMLIRDDRFVSYYAPSYTTLGSKRIVLHWEVAV